MISIQHGIPIPSDRRRGAKCKYPWASMQVGDSFFLQGKTRAQIATTAHAAGVRYGCRFMVRDVENGVRIWRTA